MKQILLVEDSRSFAALVAAQLEQSLNAQVTKVLTKADAVAALQANREDYFVAILDLFLPDAERSQVVELTEEFAIPAIIFTGDEHASLREDLLSYPRVADYIVKKRPNALEHVTEIIKRLHANQFVHALVVDDSRVSRQLAQQTLESQLIKVSAVDSAEQALSFLDQHPEISLVVTDGELGGMDGIGLTTAIRKHKGLKDLAIIGVSGNYNRAKSIEFLKAGANDYLAKPFQFEELTQRVNSNLNILSQMRELEIAKENQRMLLDMAAHDIRNPLGHIVSITELMRKKPKSLDRYLGLMEISTKQLMNLVNEIVAYSKACSSRLQQQHIDCQALIQPVIEGLADQAASKHINIQVEHNYVSMTVDQTLISQVLKNLLNNAIKFSQPHTQIEISCHIIDGYKVMQISDEGPGFSDQALAQLFTPFAKIGNKPTAGEESSGLGLALCKQLVSAHNGDIWFTNNAPLAGATAHIKLPQ